MEKKYKHQSEEEHTDETWLIPYADLLTLLLALFIVLFASSQVDQFKFEQISKSLSGAFTGGFSFLQPSSVVPPDNNVNLSYFTEQERRDGNDLSNSEILERIQQETEDLNALKMQLDVYIADNGLTDALETHLNQQQLMITISDSALFDSGSAVVKQESQLLAIAIADMLEAHAQYEIIIAGHTDNVPIRTAEFPSNWDLSAKRALNFMKILLANSESDPARFSTVGYGEYRPIASNETAEGRAENRRVEVSILRNFTDSILEMNISEQANSVQAGL